MSTEKRETPIRDNDIRRIVARAFCAWSTGATPVLLIRELDINLVWDDAALVTFGK
jgi:hypothetical protein